jgi:hypothetical protein
VAGGERRGGGSKGVVLEGVAVVFWKLQKGVEKTGAERERQST